MFIGNLDPEVDEKLLYDTFSAFGVILQTPKVRVTFIRYSITSLCVDFWTCLPSKRCVWTLFVNRLCVIPRPEIARDSRLSTLPASRHQMRLSRQWTDNTCVIVPFPYPTPSRRTRKANATDLLQVTIVDDLPLNVIWFCGSVCCLKVKRNTCVCVHCRASTGCTESSDADRQTSSALRWRSASIDAGATSRCAAASHDDAGNAPHTSNAWLALICFSVAEIIFVEQ